MAISRPGPLAGALSGPLGGSCARARGGVTVWAKRPWRTGRRSAALSLAQSRLQYWQLKWSQLTEAQRETWRAAARTLYSVNRLGVQVRLSGATWFVRVNNAQLARGTGWILTAPSRIWGPAPRILTAQANGAGIVYLTFDVPGVAAPWSIRFFGGLCCRSYPAGKARGIRFVNGIYGLTGSRYLSTDWLATVGRYPYSGEYLTLEAENRTGCYWSARSSVTFPADGSTHTFV